MRILQINNCHYRRGGADVVYMNTGELLESYGHKLVYFSVKNKKNKKSKFEKFFLNNVDFINNSLLKKILLVPRFFYSFETKNKLDKILDIYDPEIAHVHLYKGNITASFLPVLRKRKIPILISLHDYGLLDPHNILLNGDLEISEKCIHGSVFNCVLDKSNRNSYFLSFLSTIEYLFHAIFFPFDKYFNTILAVSKFSQAKHLESKKFNWSIEHLYNFSPLYNSKDVFIKDKPKYLLYYGRLSKEKGIKTLIKAVEKFKGKVELKIVGSGSLNFKDYISQNNLSYIDLIGFKQGEELHKLIRESLFVMVPSEWYENNPMTIIESYCLRTPVIGSRVGGIPEIIVEGKTGFTFKMGDVSDLADKINRGINLTLDQYKLMQQNAKEFAKQNFSPTIHYNKLIKLYKKTIKKTTKKK